MSKGDCEKCGFPLCLGVCYPCQFAEENNPVSDPQLQARMEQQRAAERRWVDTDIAAETTDRQREAAETVRVCDEIIERAKRLGGRSVDYVDAVMEKRAEAELSLERRIEGP